MSMMEWALKYEKMGFSVIPMVDKRPLISFADKPPLTESEIIEHWKKYPAANIAVRTDKFFVIDIDQHDGGDDGYLSMALYEHPEFLKATMTQKTPNGGEQLFYFKKDNKPSKQCIWNKETQSGWLPGIDIKAHPNNYVMVPPSTTKNGTYQWSVVERNGEVFTPTDIVTASSELIQEIMKASGEDQVNQYFQKPQFSRNTQSKNKTTELFETVAEGFGSEGSGRNDRLAKFVGGLLLRGVEENRIRSLAETTNSNSLDPLPKKELHATIESIIHKHMREKGAGQNR